MGTQLTDLKVRQPGVDSRLSLCMPQTQVSELISWLLRPAPILQVYVAEGGPVEFELDGVVWKTKQR